MLDQVARGSLSTIKDTLLGVLRQFTRREYPAMYEEDEMLEIEQKLRHYREKYILGRRLPTLYS